MNPGYLLKSFLLYRKEGCHKFEMAGCINVHEFYLASYLAFIHDLNQAECVLLPNHVAFEFERLIQDCDLQCRANFYTVTKYLKVS